MEASLLSLAWRHTGLALSVARVALPSSGSHSNGLATQGSRVQAPSNPTPTSLLLSLLHHTTPDYNLTTPQHLSLRQPLDCLHTHFTSAIVQSRLSILFARIHPPLSRRPRTLAQPHPNHEATNSDGRPLLVPPRSLDRHAVNTFTLHLHPPACLHSLLRAHRPTATARCVRQQDSPTPHTQPPHLPTRADIRLRG